MKTKITSVVSSFLIITVAVSLIGSVLGACTLPIPMKPPPKMTPYPTPKLTPVICGPFLHTHNVHKMVEKSHLIGLVKEPIAALSYTNEGQELIAIQAPSGELHRWDLKNNDLLISYSLGPVSVTATTFDGDGERVATAAGNTISATQAGYAVEMTGAKVWDTYTGRIIFEEGTEGERFALPEMDVAINHNGRLLATTPGASIWNIDKGSPERLKVVINEFLEDSNRQAETTAIAFDASGEWIAYAHDGGRVDVENWKTDLGQVYSFGVEETPLALVFDPSRHYLAGITTNTLVLWDMQAKWWESEKRLEQAHEYTPAAALTFSPDGKLLAISTANKWQIWSVEDQELLVEHPQGAYAVTFSPDGRLFAWGDTEGVVHIWGVLDSAPVN